MHHANKNGAPKTATERHGEEVRVLPGESLELSRNLAEGQGVERSRRFICSHRESTNHIGSSPPAEFSTEEALRAKIVADRLAARLQGFDELATLLRAEDAERMLSLAAGLWDLALDLAKRATAAVEDQ